MELNERIKYYRNRIPMTQRELADKASISLRALLNYEKGVRTPSLEVLIKISKALDVQVTDLDPNIPIWKEFDEKFNVERLAKDVKEIVNLNKNHQKILKEFTEEMKNESNVEDIIKSKSMKDIDKEYNELKIKQNSFLHKLEFFARAMREFNEFERDIIGELTEMYSNMIYDKRYDVNNLDEEQYSRLRQNIRNSIKESFEEFENK
ncbi:helix-turn-helix domain-containing protein [Clostridium tertium]|uniref:helix-turn-helix domain-containing protein n=1 Tax=Clostridium tertium TaxID=1559 RepID=UPI003522077D